MQCFKREKRHDQNSNLRFRNIWNRRSFSSILQAAAVCIDENFNEIDRFNLRGKMKKEYPVPHPKALLVNDVSIDQLKNNENSNFALISEIQNKFLSWGECLFIGYNSIGFD